MCRYYNGYASREAGDLQMSGLVEPWRPLMTRPAILKLYDELRRQVRSATYGPGNRRLLDDIYAEGLDLLDGFEKQDLVSKVEGKRYFAFTQGDKLSRAINANLYCPDFKRWENLLTCLEEGDIESLTAEVITESLYTAAITFCASVDMLKSGDRKTPGTFFEYFTAFFFTWRLGVEPQKSIQILNLDNENTRLPTDYIYNLGPQNPKFHMPVKCSSRERSIMLWAHQRLIDGVHGVGRFMGTPVILAETKTAKQKREVTEICVPDQWRLYQLYIASLKRIYYLDLPVTYERLNAALPTRTIKTLGEFFFEWSELYSC
jgi:hypothetical protein